jgi:hypothetical protein
MTEILSGGFIMDIAEVLPLTDAEKQQVLEQRLAEMKQKLPVIIFRNWRGWRDTIPISPRTVANDDCLGIGPKEKLYMGRVAGYPRDSFMEYLRAKSRIA